MNGNGIATPAKPKPYYAELRRMRVEVDAKLKAAESISRPHLLHQLGLKFDLGLGSFEKYLDFLENVAKMIEVKGDEIRWIGD